MQLVYTVPIRSGPLERIVRPLTRHATRTDWQSRRNTAYTPSVADRLWRTLLAVYPERRRA